MCHSLPSISCPSVTSAKSLRQRQKVFVITLCGRREQGSARVDQVFHKGRKVARLHLPRKACFMQQKKEREKEKSCSLSPHQNDPKVGEQINRYPFDFRGKSMSRSLRTGLT